ncbi:Bacterial Ig-like domain (group 2) [Paenibacillus sp. P1XP2]|nr:Bacterial Ig-like domain (group 2) [Paenibacillus sp. P1XP2]
MELKATVKPENATNPKIAWSTSDARLATVDDQGTVTAAGEGTAVITAQTDDGHFEASSRITVDWTAPEITIRSVTTSVYNTGMLQPQLDISDRLTGVDEAKTEVLLDGNKLGTLDGVPLYLLEPGDHVLTVQAADLAGNGAEKSVRFQVLTSYETLGELVRHFANRGWIDNQGIANSLLKKLQKRNAGSFIQEVEAQKGKHISAEAAEFLQRDAGRLLNP